MEGYPVTVFEKEPHMGGMLRYGIPAFRLQKDVIQAEIDVLKSLGVTFRNGVTVGEDVTIKELRSQGYEAFYVSIGAQKGRSLSIEGDQAENVIAGVDFLRETAVEPPKKSLGRTIVIGGGNVAIDVARSALRLDQDGVSMFCLEEREAMPALQDEVHEALEEGVVIRTAMAPEGFSSETAEPMPSSFESASAPWMKRADSHRSLMKRTLSWWKRIPFFCPWDRPSTGEAFWTDSG